VQSDQFVGELAYKNLKVLNDIGDNKFIKFDKVE
jgi:hypothetical protein